MSVGLLGLLDDIGATLARHDGDTIAGVMSRKLGRALVLGMPGFLTLLGAVGTAAMVWVGGSIIVHGLGRYDVHFIGHAIDSVAEAAAHALSSVAVAVRWMVETVIWGVIGLLIGGISIPAIGLATIPARKISKRIWQKAAD
jgi:predicted DNA repair protein MutK